MNGATLGVGGLLGQFLSEKVLNGVLGKIFESSTLTLSSLGVLLLAGVLGPLALPPALAGSLITAIIIAYTGKEVIAKRLDQQKQLQLLDKLGTVEKGDLENVLRLILRNGQNGKGAEESKEVAGFFRLPALLAIAFLIGLFLFAFACSQQPAPAPIVGEAGPAVVARAPEAEPAGEDVVMLMIELSPLHYDYDSNLLRPAEREQLRLYALALDRNPGARIRIEGHADERGSAEYNLALGETRTRSPKQYLVDLGIRNDRIAATTFGEEEPLCSDHRESCWWQNRRAEFKIVN